METVFFKGDAAVYTGKVVSLHGGTFYEVKMLEGIAVGSLKLVTVAPKGRPATYNQQQRHELWKTFGLPKGARS